MITTVSQLVKKLDTLMESGDFTTTMNTETEEVFLGGESVESISESASEALIDDGGHEDWSAIERLEVLSKGRYFVTPGETDSFGWLSGCINTPAGIIVYY